MKRMWLFAAVSLVAFSLVPVPGLAQSREEAMRLYNEAESLDANPQSNNDLVRAVQQYERAMKIFEQLGDKKRVGMCANNAGVIYSSWSQHDKAVVYFEKSLAIFRDLKDRRNEAQTLNNLGIVYKDWGQHDKAVDHYEKSLAISGDLKDRRGEARTLNNLGNVHYLWGQHDKAVDYFEKSLVIKRDLKDRRGEGYTLNNLGVVCCDWGQHDKAVVYYQESLVLCRDLKDRRGEAQTLNNLGNVHNLWGQYDKAVVYYEKSLAVKRDLKDRRGEAKSLVCLGNVYSDWGQYDKAVVYYEKGLQICRDLKDRKTEGETLNNLGNVHNLWGLSDKAIAYYEKDLAICRDLKDRRGEGTTLMNVGRVYQHRGEYKNALDNFQKGLAIYTAIRVPTRWPKSLIADVYMDEGDLAKAEPLLKEANYSSDWGRFYLLKAEFPKATAMYESLLTSAEKNRNADNLFTAYTGLGAAYEGEENDPRAKEYYENAVKFVEDVRSSLSQQEREEFFDVRINGFFRTAPYEGLARVLKRLGKQDEAFTITEFSKARVFAERVSSRAGQQSYDVPQDVVKRDADLTDRLAGLKKQLQKAYEKNNKLTIQSFEPQIKKLEEEFAEHKRMLRRKFPLFAATKYPEPMDLSNTALRDGEWVLSYDVTDPGILIYLTHGKKLVKSVFKPVARKQVDDLVRKFREPLEMGSHDNVTQKLKAFDFRSGKMLADLLLGDIVPVLPKQMPVIVIPDDCLGVLPFEMLVLNDGGSVATDKKIPSIRGAEFFGDRNPISYYQSVTALTLARTFGRSGGRGEKLLVLADPVYEMRDARAQNAGKKTRLAGASAEMYQGMMVAMEEGKTGSLRATALPFTRELANNLQKTYGTQAQVYTGLDVSKSTFLEKMAPALNQYDKIVFAGHGYFGKDLPGIQEPVLLFSLVPPGTDGYLRMSEVMGLKTNADIVALTACQSGLGRRISGEGTMGMGRAFQYAGAKSVLMSLWSVSEKTSVMLVQSFFNHLKEGNTKLEALKLARDEIRRDGWDHPFFWAPFILVGEAD